MILLGVNCGLGNSDCATLPISGLAHQRQLAGHRRGGKASAPTEEEKRQQFAEWERQIAKLHPPLKKLVAMEKLGIPKTTYYEYGSAGNQLCHASIRRRFLASAYRTHVALRSAD
jgi:hypothetical protein